VCALSGLGGSNDVSRVKRGHPKFGDIQATITGKNRHHVICGWAHGGE